MDALAEPVVPVSPKSVRVQGNRRPLNYYDCSRRDIAGLIPANANRILDVGCGRGQLGRTLRKRGHWVSGIELIPTIAEQASRNLDEVICGDVEEVDLPWRQASFDAIVCADVFEHLTDPWLTLGRLTGLLAPGGVVIASVQNVQHYRVIRDLIRGRWDYEERGQIDFGHLRFFTRKGIEHLFKQADLDLFHCRAIWSRTIWRSVCYWLTSGRCEPLLARRYLVVGRKELDFSAQPPSNALQSA